MNHSRSRNQQNSSRGRRPRYTRPSARAGLVMSPRMSFGGFGDAEAIFFEEGVALAPVSCGAKQYAVSTASGMITILPTAGLEDIEGGNLVGLVVAGRQTPEDSENASGFDKLINAARAEQLPVMAFGEGVTRTLASLGFSPPGENVPAGVLVHNGVRILESAEDLRDAIASFRGLQKAAA